MIPLGMGSANFMELQSRMQSELLGNPELLRQVLDNPLTQQLMNDPQNMRTLITSNPQMQELMERYPEINNMLNNPELLRQTTELARNPSMLQQLMRNHESLEGITGGFNPLQRMYRDIQDPMLSTATEQIGRNPFTGATEHSSTGITNPSMASLIQQMSENPQLMQNMLSAPYTQSVMQALAADPNMASAVIAGNPLVAGNPALQVIMIIF